MMQSLTKIFRQSLQIDSLDHDMFAQDTHLHRFKFLILGGVSILLLFSAIAASIAAEDYYIIPAFVLAAALIGGSWGYYKKHPAGNFLTPMLITGIIIMLSGCYLFFTSKTDLGVYWFLLYPVIMIFSLGLFYGSLLFAFSYVLLIIIFSTPLQASVYFHPASPAYFLTAIFAAFIFSWSMEYISGRAHLSLLKAFNLKEEEARTDSLTGLGNRRDLQNHLNWLQAQSVRSGHTFAINIVDIDFFKRVNDKYGHDMGDLVLRHVAAILVGQVRSADRVFRWGGEEFAILMPATGTIEALIIAERLRQAVQDLPYRDVDGNLIRLTISVGIYSASVNKLGSQSVHEQIKQADMNLYKAKQLGRNRVYG
ncbi:MAG: GGDEF domain-containing protein [Desulfarculales bacterium]|jgi:diguanylate cyclase (GGDEF)-like protein|nr:GGDEF domain-containing protein [Desulfarculales bacterium]